MMKDLRSGTHVELTSHDGQNLSGEVLFSDEVLKYFVFRKSFHLLLIFFRTTFEKKWAQCF